MSWSKGQFVDAAFEEIGMATYVFDLSADQLQGALRRLDTMIASWNALGIRLGYPLPSSPQNSELNDETFVPDSANQSIYTNLAIAIAPSYGKAVSMDTKAIAKNTYNTLLSRAAYPMEKQLPGEMPSGAGNKPWCYDDPFLQTPVDPILAGQDGKIEFN